MSGKKSSEYTSPRIYADTHSVVEGYSKETGLSIVKSYKVLIETGMLSIQEANPTFKKIIKEG